MPGKEGYPKNEKARKTTESDLVLQLNRNSPRSSAPALPRKTPAFSAGQALRALRDAKHPPTTPSEGTPETPSERNLATYESTLDSRRASQEVCRITSKPWASEKVCHHELDWT